MYGIVLRQRTDGSASDSGSDAVGYEGTGTVLGDHQTCAGKTIMDMRTS
jgi:hypothetical protein